MTGHAQPRVAALVGAACLVLGALPACGSVTVSGPDGCRPAAAALDAPAPAPSAAAEDPTEPWPAVAAVTDITTAVFSVTGDRPHASPVATWRWDDEPGPLPVEDCRAAVERALDAWFDAWRPDGAPRWRPVGPDVEADVTFGWRHGEHGDERPFGRDPSLAHTGPGAGGLFVHVDAGRRWYAGLRPEADEDPTGRSLEFSLRHEIGHALGLDHVTEPEALMHPDPTVTAPSRHDLAGVASIHGGGADGPGDLLIVPAGQASSEPAPGATTFPAAAPLWTLRGVAPAAGTDWRLLDVDDDGDDDVLVWRTDAGGHGALMIFLMERGAHGPELASTRGPLFDIVPVGGTVSLHRTPAPEHPGRPGQADGPDWTWFVVRPAADAEEAGRDRTYAFERSGRLMTPDPIERRAVDPDADGRAQPDHLVPDVTVPPPPGRDDVVDARRGDLDGDGRAEVVLRRR